MGADSVLDNLEGEGGVHQPLSTPSLRMYPQVHLHLRKCKTMDKICLGKNKLKSLNVYYQYYKKNGAILFEIESLLSKCKIKTMYRKRLNSLGKWSSIPPSRGDKLMDLKCHKGGRNMAGSENPHSYRGRNGGRVYLIGKGSRNGRP